jgi:hypothetical protein
MLLQTKGPEDTDWRTINSATHGHTPDTVRVARGHLEFQRTMWQQNYHLFIGHVFRIVED